MNFYSPNLTLISFHPYRCGETIPKREQFNDLSIDLPRRKKPLPPRSIQDSLDLFFRVISLIYLYSSFLYLIDNYVWS